MFDTDNRKEEMKRAAALHGLLGRIVDELDLTHDRTAPAELRARAAILKIDDALTRFADEFAIYKVGGVLTIRRREEMRFED